jgi:hypothetical protein
MIIFANDSKELQAMRYVVYDCLKTSGYKEGDNPRVRITIQSLRESRFGEEYIFRDLSDEYIADLREQVFVKELGWYRCEV